MFITETKGSKRTREKKSHLDLADAADGLLCSVGHGKGHAEALAAEALEGTEDSWGLSKGRSRALPKAVLVLLAVLGESIIASSQEANLVLALRVNNARGAVRPVAI